MKRKSIVITSVLAVALLATLSIAAAVSVPNDDRDSTSDAKYISTSFEISPEEVGLTEEDVELFCKGMEELEASDEYLIVSVDENNELSADITTTVDGGENKIKSLWNGWRVYISSEVVEMLIDEYDAEKVLTANIPGISKLGKSFMQVLKVGLFNAAYNYLGDYLTSDNDSGLYFDVTYKERKKVLWFTMIHYHYPRVTNMGYQ